MVVEPWSIGDGCRIDIILDQSKVIEWLYIYNRFLSSNFDFEFKLGKRRLFLGRILKELFR